jgi:hypothetical protein
MRTALIVLLLLPARLFAAPPMLGTVQVHSFVIAHACAVDGQLVTNRHVIDPRLQFDGAVSLSVRFSTPQGEEGWARTGWRSTSEDLAFLIPETPLTYYAPRAASAPKQGDHVRWVGYSWKSRTRAFERKEFGGRVSQITAGHIIVEEPTSQGTSGGCVYDAVGDVVGIISSQVPTEDNSAATVVVSLYGKWFR